MPDSQPLKILGHEFPPAKHIQLSGDTVLHLEQQAVYIWLRGNECLYVGCSADVFRRLRRNHHIINKLDPVQPEDIFYVCLGETKLFEAEAIQKLKPKYNRGAWIRDNTIREYAETGSRYWYLPRNLRRPLHALTYEERIERRRLRREFQQEYFERKKNELNDNGTTPTPLDDSLR